MSIEIGSAYLTIIPSMKGIKGELNSQLSSINITPAANSLGKKFASSVGKALQSDLGRNVTKTLTGIDTSSLKKAVESVMSIATKGATEGYGLKSLGENITKASSAAKTLGKTLTNNVTVPATKVAGTIAGITGAATAAATGVASIFAFKGWNRLVQIDSAQKKLEGLGHSAEEVQLIMQNANTAVLGTAYGLGEAATVAASAVAAGVKPGEELESTLKTIGDTATIAGATFAETGAIFNSVMARGKLQGDDMLQLTMRGVPVLQALADHLQVTQEEVSAMVSGGVIDFKTFREALDNYLGGSALKSGEMITGAISNLNAAIGRVGASFLNAGKDGGGFFDQLIPLIGEATTAISGLQNVAGEWGTVFGKGFDIVVNRVKDLGKSLLGDFDLTPTKEAADLIYDIINGIFDIIDVTAVKGQEFFSTIFDGFDISDISTMFETASGVISGAFDIVIGTAKIVKSAWEGLPEPIQNFIIQAGLIAPAFGPVIEIVGKVGSVIGGVVSGVGSVIGAVAKFGVVVSVFNTVRAAAKLLADQILKIREASSVIAPGIGQVASGLGTAFGGATTVINGATTGVINFSRALGTTAIASVSAFTDAVVTSGAIVAATMGDAMNSIKSMDFTGAAASFIAGGEEIKDVFSNATKTVSENLKNVSSISSDSSKTIAKGLGEIGKGFDQVKAGSEGIKEGLSEVGEVGKEAANGIKSGFAGIGGILKSAWNGFKEGKGIVGSFKGAVAGAVTGTKDLFNSIKATGGVGSILKGIAGPLSAIAGPAIISGLFALKDAMDQAAEEARQFESATTGLVAAAEGVSSGVYSATSGLEKYDQVVKNVQPTIQELVKDQAALATKLSETNTGLYGDAAMLGEYGKTVEELSNKYDEYGNRVELTANEQAKFKYAIDQINKITGANFQVIDAANGVFADQEGVIQNTCAAIDDYIAKTNAAATATAIASAKTEILSQAYRDQAKYNSLLSQRAEKERELQEVINDPSYMGGGDAREQRIITLRSELQALEGQSESAKTLAEDAWKSAEYLDDALDRNAKVASGMGTAWEKWATTSVDAMRAFAGLEENQYSFADALEGAGISVEEFVQKVGDRLPEFAQNFHGDIGDVSTLLSEIGISFKDTGDQINEVIAGIIRDSEGAGTKLKEAFDTANISPTDFAQVLEDAGVSVEEFSKLTSDQVAELVKSYDGVEDIKGKVEGMLEANKEVINSNAELVSSSKEASNEASGSYDSIKQAASDAKQEISNLNTEVSGTLGNMASSIDEGLNGATESISSWVSQAETSFTDFSNKASEYGSQVGSNYASSIGESEGEVQGAVNSLGSNVDLLSGFASRAYSYGSEIGSNLASGIRSQVSAVSAAANELAAAAAAPIKHSKPKVGPLSSGEEIFGIHLGQNLARGIKKSRSIVAQASSDLAQTVVDYLGHSKPKEGPLSTGEYVFGLHAGNNFASGLTASIANARKAAKDYAFVVQDNMVAGLDELANAVRFNLSSADRALEELINSYRSRAQDFKEVSHTIGDAIWGIASGEINQAWNNAFDWSGWEVDNLVGSEEFNEFRKGLTDTIWNVRTWGNTMNALFERSGVIFTKEFCEAILDGSQDSMVAMEKLAEMSDEQLQAMSNAYKQVAQAERENELVQRSLWVNSLKVLNSQGKDSKDWLLDFRETCLDVKEALYSNKGVSSAFEKAGKSIEGFAADLQSLEYSMDDFLDDLDDFVDQVSDGMSRMSRENQTSFYDWQTNLKANMAESQKYAENITKVMNQIPDEIDSEAFRKAILEGGYGQWGQVMADLATKSQDEIIAAVNLYNESVAEAQQSMIEQFSALAPGEEIMAALAQGILDAGTSVVAANENTLDECVNVVTVYIGEMENAGNQLMNGLANGINNGSDMVIELLGNVVDSAIQNARKTAQIASPSKRTHWLGEMLGAGLAEGIDDQSNSVTSTFGKMINSVIAGAKGLGTKLISVFYEGINAAKIRLSQASNSMANTVSNALSREEGVWIYGVHTVESYADGMTSNRVLNKVDSAAKKIIGTFYSSMRKAQKDENAKFLSSAEGLMGDLGRAFKVSKYTDYELPITGAVYESMKAIEAAGYTFESFKKKYEDMNEEMAEWQEKLSDPYASESVLKQYEEWRKEYDEWSRLTSKVTASIAEMEASQSMYKVQDDIISSTVSSAEWSQALTSLYQKTGVAFSKEFVERIMAGRDDYKQAIKDMANMSASQVQNMVDSFNDTARAEREMELAGKKLWVMSLKTLLTQGKNVKDFLLDMTEATLDLAEVFYSDQGLNAALEASGRSIEGFASDILSLGISVEDFSRNLTEYTNKVSDGFARMSSKGQMSLSSWSKNLEKNIKASREYTANLADVMNAIPESVDSEAFRKAVYEGGFDQFGKIIKQLSKMSADEIAEYIELFNASIIEGQGAALDQMGSLGLGEQLLNETMKGFTSNEENWKGQIVSVFEAANDALSDTADKWYATGKTLGSAAQQGFFDIWHPASEEARQAWMNQYGYSTWGLPTDNRSSAISMGDNNITVYATVNGDADIDLLANTIGRKVTTAQDRQLKALGLA